MFKGKLQQQQQQPPLSRNIRIPIWDALGPASLHCQRLKLKEEKSAITDRAWPPRKQNPGLFWGMGFTRLWVNMCFSAIDSTTMWWNWLCSKPKTPDGPSFNLVYFSSKHSSRNQNKQKHKSLCMYVCVYHIYVCVCVCVPACVFPCMCFIYIQSLA